LRNISDKNFRQIKTHFMAINVFENRAFCEIMWVKYGRAGQATYENMAHAHYMQEAEDYKYTLGISNT
jgi:hypothetical protein